MPRTPVVVASFAVGMSLLAAGSASWAPSAFHGAPAAFAHRHHAPAATPVKAEVFSPEAGSTQGNNGQGLVVDLAFHTHQAQLLPAQFRLALPNPTAGAAGPLAAPGMNPAFPGLVVTLSTTSAAAGGPTENLANLFQIVSTSHQANGAFEVWATWTNPKPLFGVGVASTLHAYTVLGQAPNQVPVHRAGLTLTSQVRTVHFMMAGPTP